MDYQKSKKLLKDQREKAMSLLDEINSSTFSNERKGNKKTRKTIFLINTVSRVLRNNRNVIANA